jgi:4-amino-4-deoxy-L-arabinose transferase-like glycosyltransferase
MTRSLLEDRRTLWIIAALIALLFATANLPWQLDDYDQAKQAFTSFEMIQLGHWLYQHTPHERVATKPPLVGWISAELFEVTRSWEIAWRLPSILAALALAIILFRAARCAYGSTAGLIALAAFGFNLLSPRLASLVRTDMPLALVIFLIGLLVWRKIRAGTEWTQREQVYVFLLLTAAMLIKGPIVYAFLLPGIAINAGAVALWATRTPRAAKRLQSASPGPPREGFAAPNWWPWVASLAIFLVWVIGGIRFQPGFYQEVVLREFVGRFGETIHRPQPFFFYFPHLLHKFAPWSVLMIGIAIFDLRSRDWRFRPAFREMSPEVLWLLCWSIGGLIAMSLIPSKRVDRIFPVIPPLCLLLAARIGRAGALPRPDIAARRSYLLLVITVVMSVLFTGGYTGWKIVTGYRDHRDALAIFGRDVRHEAEARHWDYEVVSAKNEGLLLYLRKTQFIEPQNAVTEWNNGTLDALVISRDKAAILMPKLQGAVLWESEQPRARDYVLITR